METADVTYLYASPFPREGVWAAGRGVSSRPAGYPTRGGPPAAEWRKGSSLTHLLTGTLAVRGGAAVSPC